MLYMISIGEQTLSWAFVRITLTLEFPAASVVITFRWRSHSLHSDYQRVRDVELIVLLVVVVSWLCAFLGEYDSPSGALGTKVSSHSSSRVPHHTIRVNCQQERAPATTSK